MNILLTNPFAVLVLYYFCMIIFYLKTTNDEKKTQGDNAVKIL